MNAWRQMNSDKPQCEVAGAMSKKQSILPHSEVLWFRCPCAYFFHLRTLFPCGEQSKERKTLWKSFKAVLVS